MVTSIEITKLRARCLAMKDDKGKKIPDYQIAAAAGLNPTELSMLNLGRRPFTRPQLMKLCRYFKCEPKDIAGWVEFQVPD